VNIMLPQPISWSEPPEDEASPLAQMDLVHALEEQIAAGLPPGLALDLVLNELVVRAAGATRARSAALALKRGDEMVCRAATGEHAPDLGIPLNTRDGLSGACLRTRQSQLCLDTEADARVDADACRRLGIRSMLIVPVLEGEDLAGVLEVFATEPAEFVDSDQNLLEIFARDVTRIRHAAVELEQGSPPTTPPPVQILPPSPPGASPVPRKARAPYEGWTLILGTLAILLTIALSLLIGSRIAWFAPPAPVGSASYPLPPQELVPSQAPKVPRAKAANSNSSSVRKPAEDLSGGGLVVYEKGKVVFRVKPAPPEAASAPSNINGKGMAVGPAWLAPDLAERRIAQRNEPQYPADALIAHRSGDVVLEVIVGRDGSVTSTRGLSGDPLLIAAAVEAVRTWRYEPYRIQGRPTEFQTDVTLRFSLPQ